MILSYPVTVGSREIWLVGDPVEAATCAYVLDQITVEELEELVGRFLAGECRTPVFDISNW